jgi:hypothetical protein
MIRFIEKDTGLAAGVLIYAACQLMTIAYIDNDASY